MNKKAYIIPTIKAKVVEIEDCLAVDSRLHEDDDNPGVTPIDDPWDGEFGANDNNIWDN